MESNTTPARRIIIKKHKLKKQNEINQNDNNKWFQYRDRRITTRIIIYVIHKNTMIIKKMWMHHMKNGIIHVPFAYTKNETVNKN